MIIESFEGFSTIDYTTNFLYSVQSHSENLISLSIRS